MVRQGVDRDVRELRLNGRRNGVVRVRGEVQAVVSLRNADLTLVLSSAHVVAQRPPAGRAHVLAEPRRLFPALAAHANAAVVARNPAANLTWREDAQVLQIRRICRYACFADTQILPF